MNVVVEARPVGPVVWQRVMTRADGEQAPDDPEGAPERADVREWAKVPSARNVYPSHHENARKRLTHRDGDSRVTLVVPQQDVVSRGVFLDEVVLEEQGLRLVRHDDRVEVDDLAHQRPMLRAVVVVRREIGAYARSKVFGFAHIQHCALRILPQVHTGAVGQTGDLAAKRVGCVHAWPRGVSAGASRRGKRVRRRGPLRCHPPTLAAGRASVAHPTPLLRPAWTP